VKLLMDHCALRNVRLVFAESCTGGLIAAVMTALPGSSRVVDRGFVVYSYESKEHERQRNRSQWTKPSGAMPNGSAWACLRNYGRMWSPHRFQPQSASLASLWTNTGNRVDDSMKRGTVMR
jgi:hypothetical protein